MAVQGGTCIFPCPSLTQQPQHEGVCRGAEPTAAPSALSSAGPCPDPSQLPSPSPAEKARAQHLLTARDPQLTPQTLAPNSASPAPHLPLFLHDCERRTSQLFYSCLGLNIWTVTCPDLYTPACTEHPYLTSCLPLVLPALCPALQDEHKHATVCSPMVTLDPESA